jgi:hypothetical protein
MSEKIIKKKQFWNFLNRPRIHPETGYSDHDFLWFYLK